MTDLAQQALELCWEIEKFPASEHQTATVLKASALHQALAASPLPKAETQEAVQEGGVQDPRIPGLVNGIRSLILFHTKNGTMHGDCASDFAELVAPYPSYAASGEVTNEAAAPKHLHTSGDASPPQEGEK